MAVGEDWEPSGPQGWEGEIEDLIQATIAPQSSLARVDKVGDPAGASKAQRGGDQSETMPSFVPAQPGAEHARGPAASVSDLAGGDTRDPRDRLDHPRHDRAPDRALALRMLGRTRLRLDDLPHLPNSEIGAQKDPVPDALPSAPMPPAHREGCRVYHLVGHLPPPCWSTWWLCVKYSTSVQPLPTIHRWCKLHPFAKRCHMTEVPIVAGPALGL
jgi:hypothetical protein